MTAPETLADKLAKIDALRSENAAGDPPIFERMVDALEICVEGGLHKCPRSAIPTVCGCAPGKCAAVREGRP